VIVDLLHDEQGDPGPDGQRPSRFQVQHAAGGAARREGDERGQDPSDPRADERDQVEQPGHQAHDRPVRETHRPEHDRRRRPHEERDEELTPEEPSHRPAQLLHHGQEARAAAQRNDGHQAAPDLRQVHHEVEGQDRAEHDHQSEMKHASGEGEQLPQVIEHRSLALRVENCLRVDGEAESLGE
jgi:hypothetical protein